MARPHDAAFDRFVAGGSHALLRLATLLTQDHGHAEDLVQTALLKTYQRWPTLRDPDNAAAYARRVLVTTAASWRRRRSAQELVDMPASDVVSVDPDRIADRAVMAAALRSLPPRMRAVLVLRYWEDLSEVATAEMLGCSVHTVRSQTSRGLARLRTTLAPAQPITAKGP